MPESKDLYPKDVSDFYEFLNDHTQEITEDERERIEDDELKSSDKLLDVEDEELDIKDNKLKPIVEKDKVMILAASRLKESSEELKDLLK